MNIRNNLMRATMTLAAIAGAAAVGGCKHDVWEGQSEEVLSLYRVPDSAKKVGEGTGLLEFTGPQYGVIYIVDVDQPLTISSTDGEVKKTVHRIVLQALLLPGHQYYFDPQAGRAGVRNSQREPTYVRTTPGHRYQAWWDTKEVGDRAPTVTR